MAGSKDNIVELGKATRFLPGNPGKKKGAVGIRKRLMQILDASGETVILKKNIVRKHRNGNIRIKIPSDMDLAMKLNQNALSGDLNASTKAILAIIEQTDIYNEKNKDQDKTLDYTKYITKGYEANTLYLLNARSTCRIRVNRGGTRSAKTYSISQIAIDWLLTGYVGDLNIPDGAFDIIRKTLPALKASVLKDLLQIIKDRNLNNIISHHKTDKTFTIKGIDRVINYFSVDEESKVRGSKRKILWINEADGVTFEDFRQLNMRGVELCFLDFNPSKFDGWIREEIEKKRYNEMKDVEIIISTYRDNLFLTSQEIREIEYLEKGNPEFWAVFGEGEYAKLAGVVFPDWELYDKNTFDRVVQDSKVYTVGGLDFGMTNPSALTKIHIDKENRKIYLHEILYAPGLSTGVLGENIANNFDINTMVACDSAEPRTIGELKKLGHHNVIKCAKKQIVSDIRRIKGYHLIIREGSNNLIREFNTYHRPSVDGKVVSEIPVPKNDHGIDSVRYGIIYGLNILK